MTLLPCLDCGRPSPASRCDEHTVDRRPPKANTKARGYDHVWRKLSERARRLQPWCSDCGTVEDLTTDHSPEAWKRKANGLPIRLADVDVVCRPCNGKRGPARETAEARGDTPTGNAGDPHGEAETRSHTPGGYV